MVQKWKFRKVDTTFSEDSTYEKELMAALPLTVLAINKLKVEYRGKF